MKKIIIILTLFIGAIASLCGQSLDHRYYITRSFELTEDSSGTPILKEHYSEQKSFVSERSFSENAVHVYKDFSFSIDAIKLEFNRSNLNIKDFSIWTPQYADVFYNDDTVYTAYLPGRIMKNSKYKLLVDKTYKDVAYMPVLTVPNYNYLGHYITEITVPENYRVEYEIKFTREEYPYELIESEEEGKKIYQIKFDKIDFAPLFYNFQQNEEHAYIIAHIKKNEETINPVTPESFVKWYASITTLEPELSDSTKNPLTEELKVFDNDLDKVKHIYDFVRTNFRYIADMEGTHTIIPRSPSEVLKRFYGDCKERASLVSALASNAGIDVNMALVSSDVKPVFNSTAISKYNHMICAFDYHDSTYLFDPTSRFSQFNILDDHLAGKEILVLDKNNPRVIIPEVSGSENDIEMTINVKAGMEGTADAIITFGNDLTDYLWYIHENSTKNQLENLLSSLVGSSLYKVKTKNFSDFKVENKRFTTNAKFDLEDFFITSDTKKYVPRTIFRLFDRTILTRSDDPYYVLADQPYRMKITLNIDDPAYKPHEDSGSFGDKESVVKFYTNMVDNGDGSTTIEYEVFQDKLYLEGKKKEQFLNFCDYYFSAKKDMFVLRGVK